MQEIWNGMKTYYFTQFGNRMAEDEGEKFTELGKWYIKPMALYVEGIRLQYCEVIDFK